ncbi:GNAT family N-acetyltransferase [Sediminicola luteus]|uniref:N-acetyltransferase domain-containing protein n=1 Tax=Sediminicola luteus TaxID=319238 RepID=A0A2A4GBW5_9FLAO|nr:GNAT family N-acetyltransferase [Sediminicola luteus]PCE66449.1 hypothetical protein B7P33_03910 [Sediminicola luteus]
MALRFSPCTEAELDLLIRIAKDTFHAAFADQNDPADFANYMKRAFAKPTLLAELQEPNSTFYFIYEQEILVGYLKCNVAPAQTDLNDPESLELQRIYILPEFQGNGHGTEIMAWVKQIAREKGKIKLWLGVWEANLRAIAFYERHGFKKIGEHPYLIGTDEQMDWVMQVRL